MPFPVRLIAAILFIIIILTTPAAADNSQTGHHFIVRHIYDDMTFLLSRPDFSLVMGGLAFSPTVFHSTFNDEAADSTTLWTKSLFADKFFEPGEVVGQGIIPVSASVAIWSIGKINGSRPMQAFGSDLLRVQAINGMLTGAMKFAVNRKRPNGAPYSYPSGHTSSAFATAGVIYVHLGKTWGYPAFALATYVGISRLQENKHYLSDVVAGGILGSYISLTISRRTFHGNSFSLAPAVIGQGSGIALSYRF